MVTNGDAMIRKPLLRADGVAYARIASTEALLTVNPIFSGT
jgi:hypothetical protein